MILREKSSRLSRDDKVIAKAYLMASFGGIWPHDRHTIVT